MLLLLLVLIQVKVIRMKVYDLNIDLINNKTKKRIEPRPNLDKEKILCKHCKRTASNGIRCLGICVSDNEY